MLSLMRVTDRKLECIKSWVGMIVPGKSITDHVTLLELLDIIDDSHLSSTTAAEDAIKKIHLALSNFYAIDIAVLLSPTKNEENVYSTYGYCCLLLLILAMGLRLKCETFMSAAFNLPSPMHYSVVEMTQPLIDAHSVTLASFAGLNADSESQPFTPIIRENVMRTPPFTCPAGGCCTNELFPSKLRCLSPTTAVASPSLPLFTRPRMNLRTRHPNFMSFEFESDLIDSPLYSLKQILDSPNLISKSQYLTKVEELRQVSAQLAEVQHMLDETNMDLQRLTSSHHVLQLEYKEMEVRLKRREAEMGELRDELAFEREARCNCEDSLRNTEGLRERLASALKEVKSLASVSAENRELRDQLIHLRNQVKTLQNLRPLLVDQRLMRQKLTAMKEQVRVADEKILQLIREREDSLATSHPDRSVSRIHSSQQSGRDMVEVATEHSTFPVRGSGFSPDSSQPDFETHVDDQAEPFEICADNVPSPILSPVADNPVVLTSENLACVVAASSQIQLLEVSLSSVKEDLQRAHQQSVRWQWQAIVARSLSLHRLNKLQTLRTALEDIKQSTSLHEAVYSDKLDWMNSRVNALESRLKEAEQAVLSFDQKHSKARSLWSAREQELLSQLQNFENAKKTACSLSMELESLEKLNQTKDEEIFRLRALLDDLQSDIERKLELMEHDVNTHRKSLEAEVTDLRGLLQKEKQACERLTTQLNEQLSANSAYRKACETELDNLRNQLGIASSEKAACLLECDKKCESIRSRCDVELNLMKESHDAMSRQAALLKLSLEEAEGKIKSQKDELEVLSSVSARRQHELADLRTQLSESREKSLSLERTLATIQSEAKQKTILCSELESRLGTAESERHTLEARCTSLTNRCASLESEVSLYANRAKQCQQMADAALQDQTEWERIAAVLRDQLRQVRSDWVHCQTQLDQTHSQLVQAKQSLYETKLQLQETEFNRAQTTERLTFLESRSRRVESRLVRSTISLYTASQSIDEPKVTELDLPNMGENDKTIELTPVKSHTQSSLSSPLSVNRNTSLTFVSPLPLPTCDHAVQKSPGPSLPQRYRTVRNVAVQKCGSHSLLKRTYIPCSNIGCTKQRHCLPFACSTAPISPQSLRFGSVFSGNSPLVHSRRFGRLIQESEEDLRSLVTGPLYTKCVPRPHEHNRGEEPRESHVLSTVWPESDAPDNKIPYSRSMCVVRGAYIPETPLPWNVPSACGTRLQSVSVTDLITPSLSVHTSDPSVNSEFLQPSNISVEPYGSSHTRSKKHPKFWHFKKLRKRSKHNSLVSSNPDFISSSTVQSLHQSTKLTDSLSLK